MGTRNLICIVYKNEYRLANYCQWDGYPDGQGVYVLEFLKKTDRKKFVSQLEKVSFISDDMLEQTWIECGKNPDRNYVNMEIADRHTRRYPHLSRDTGAKILDLIYNNDSCALAVINTINFAADSLYCEYAYVIDLDKNTFEIFEGFNKTPLKKEDRFYFLQPKRKDQSEKYHPVKLRKSYHLDNLPSENDFIEDLKENDDYGP